SSVRRRPFRCEREGRRSLWVGAFAAQSASGEVNREAQGSSSGEPECSTGRMSCVTAAQASSSMASPGQLNRMVSDSLDIDPSGFIRSITLEAPRTMASPAAQSALTNVRVLFGSLPSPAPLLTSVRSRASSAWASSASATDCRSSTEAERISSTGFSATFPRAESVQPPSPVSSSFHFPASPGPAGPWVWKPEGASKTHTEGTWSFCVSASPLPEAGAAAFEASSVEDVSVPGLPVCSDEAAPSEQPASSPSARAPATNTCLPGRVIVAHRLQACCGAAGGLRTMHSWSPPSIPRPQCPAHGRSTQARASGSGGGQGRLVECGALPGHLLHVALSTVGRSGYLPLLS